MITSKTLTITQLNFYVKSLLEGDRNISSVCVKGEISNLTYHGSGHIYMTLKDEKSAVRAVMFAGDRRNLKFRLEEGMKIFAAGRVTLYGATGSYQIILSDIQPDGVGALNLAYEQLKQKLEAEGLFDSRHKKPLPELPSRIGVITSPTGAAVQDICNILKRRYPIGTIIFCPVLVQGSGAAAELTEAVRRFNRLRGADVIIIGRGGGSIEDLWAFNDESLARAIYECEIPIVSAVGHETDFTICDFAADVRASTPSAAAELVSSVTNENMLSDIHNFMNDIYYSMQRRIHNEYQRYERAANARAFKNPHDIIKNRQMKLDVLHEKLKGSYSKKLSAEKERFAELAAKLDTLSPLKILSRGYSVTKKDGHIINSVLQVNPNDKIEVVLSDGSMECTVTGGHQNEI